MGEENFFLIDLYEISHTFYQIFIDLWPMDEAIILNFPKKKRIAAHSFNFSHNYIIWMDLNSKSPSSMPLPLSFVPLN